MTERTLVVIWRQHEGWSSQFLLGLVAVPFGCGGVCLLTQLLPNWRTAEGPLLAFTGAVLLIGSISSYALIAARLNQTAVKLGADALIVESGPVPWFGDRTVTRSEIHSVGVHVRRWQNPIEHSVFARLRDGRRVALLHHVTFAAAHQVAGIITDWLSEPIGQNSSISPSETGGASHS